MKIELLFGEGTLVLDLPGRWESLPPPDPETLPSPPDALSHALQFPEAGPSLAERVATCGKVVLSIPDLTRPFPFRDSLPQLLETLRRSGVGDEKISAIVATGIHRPLSDAEIASLLGEPGRRIRARNHDPHAGLESLGTTSRSTPVHVNRRICDAGLVVCLGSIGFHFHAGFGGGPKGIVPGLAGAETARLNHLLALSGPGNSWHPGCGPGKLAGNPVHEDLMEAVGLLPTPVFLVNFVPGAGATPAAVKAGALKEAHRSACSLYARHFSRTVEEPFDAVLVSAGGRPGDVNLIQSHKAAAHAAGALREGGVLILVAQCAEGMGHPDLDFWFGRAMEDMKGLSMETGRKYVQTAYSFREKAGRYRFLVLSDLPPDPLRRAGLIPAGSPGEAADCLEAELGKDFRGLVVPDSAVLYMRPGVAKTPRR